MLQNLTGWHALVILAVIVLIFGAAKLPALAKSVGQSVRILKKEVASPDEEQDRADAATAAPQDAAPAPVRSAS
ncbi:twin-arginine translocase TatA/TatE family subunit [Arenivirga flava]|uniref:Sec-independent protein translocase protein TatA n=1 Tax=Arenivirga flava TaxID=1930060 RepID=A0AA37UDJ0_9MICO|nr:twin-arginine translocase TatA/TatE family subunit [Arenivirga flava]GMA28623.1 hypothetical protein GCM10025874_18760 [Arenivirga flava]